MQKIITVWAFGVAISACAPEQNPEPAKASRAALAAHTATTHDLTGANNASSARQASLNQLAETLKVQYQVINNRVADGCDPEQADGNCFLAELTLSTPAPSEIHDWRLYFSFMSPVSESLSPDFDIFHVNGDLHYLQPKAHFDQWQSTRSVSIPFKAGFWQISAYDVPPNFYLVAEGLQPALVASTQATVDPETQLEVLGFASQMSDRLKHLKRTEADQTIQANAAVLFERNRRLNAWPVSDMPRVIPKPTKQIVSQSAARLDLSAGLTLIANDFNVDLSNPAVARLRQLGIRVGDSGGIVLSLHRSAQIKNSHGYRLSVEADKINIQAKDEAGAFYALQTLASLIHLDKSDIPRLEIIDQPRFAFRGLHLDVARNFRDKAFVLRLLDQMAAYKLNKLHLHLGDDEGWRLEIPGLPELTQIGAKRCHDLSETRCLLPQLGTGPNSDGKTNRNDGFYSLTDYQEILAAASRRHIEVIPSFDMPGHSRAAVKSMEARYRRLQSQGKTEMAEEFLLSDLNDQSQYQSVQYYSDNTLNVCKASTYRFVEKVLQEVIDLHGAAGVPLTTYHIGADETAGAWKGSPECQAFIEKHSLKVSQLSDYFIQRVAKFLASQGIIAAGWSDGLAHLDKHTMPETVQINAWKPLFWDGHKVAHSAANKDWRVVISSPDVTYFDFPYEADPLERGYYWGSRYTNTRQVFEFMPENLPLHAEIWTDRENRPMQLDDRPVQGEPDEPNYQPMKRGKRFYGLQGHLWSEMVRSDAIAEYMLFPRLIALAERAWHKPEWEPPYRHEGAMYSPKSDFFNDNLLQLRAQDWLEFASALATKEFPKLDEAGWRYRLPTLGAKVVDGKLLINSAFPGLPMQYQLDQQTWQDYPRGNNGVAVSSGQVIRVRAKAPKSERVGRSLPVSNP